jgi:hypothetical protein
VTALAFGVCKFQVTLPELAGGRGVVLNGEFAVGRVAYPGDRRSEAPLFASWRSVAGAVMARDGLGLAILGAWWLYGRRRRDRSSGPPAVG